ncbi:MAG: Hsp70 family protein [Pirellulales bacterium]|nr:Hsp70 family protein [Pirellulales bacterium]
MNDNPGKSEATDEQDETRFHQASTDDVTAGDPDETAIGGVAAADEPESGKPKLPVLGDYVLLGKIGAGGMGMVFKARHVRMDRIVALKVLPRNMMKHPEAVDRFHQEVKAAAQLFHPNIVTAFDAGEDSGVHFLVMEYVDGQPLSRLIKEHGPFNVEKAVDYILQAATGLQSAHDRGMVHRDIKPSNLMLDVDGVVKLLDMGTARYGQEQDENLTKSGVIMGTVNYMSPEQAKDPHSVDHRSDIYSLGCTLYYMLIGKSVYSGDMIQTLMAHANSNIPSMCAQNDEIPIWLDDIFAKLVAKKPEDRYDNLGEFRQDLQEAFANRSDDDESSSLLTELRRAQNVQGFPIGVDFGSSSSRMAWMNTQGALQSIMDDDGDAETPSAVVVVDAMNTAIGKKAIQRSIENVESIALESKRFIGRPFFPADLGGEKYPPEVLGALVLAKMAGDAQRVVGQCKEVAIAVPGFYGEVHRETVQHMAEIAGLEVTGLVDESLATALSFYVSADARLNENSVIIDLGAGKLDLAVVEFDEGTLRVKSTGGDARLGGADFDELLADLVSDGLVGAYQYDPREDMRQAMQLMKGCQWAKERLSEKEIVAIKVQVPGQITKVSVGRNKLEEVAAGLLRKIKSYIVGAIEESGINAQEIGRVLLAGGSCKMPMIQELVKGEFPNAEYTLMDAGCVAEGAAIYASIRQATNSGQKPAIKVEAVTARGLGIQGTDMKSGTKVNFVIVPKGTPRPVRAKKVFPTHEENQKSLILQLLEGEGKDPLDCVDVGVCRVEGLPANLPIKTELTLFFRYDADGRLSVLASLPNNPQQISVPVIRRDEMESVDLYRWREWVETVMLCSGM